MNYGALFRSALVALLRNKLRSILTVLGITIGIAAVICVVAIGNAGQARVQQQLNNLGDNFVWIEAGGRAINGVRTGTHDTKTLVMADAIALKNQISILKAVSPNVGPNLLQNAEFSQGAKGWPMENTAPARGSMRIDDALSGAPGVTGRAVHFNVAAIGKQSWNVQCYQMGVNLKEGEKYLLSFWGKSDRTRSIRIDGILDKADWHPIGLGTSVKLGANWEKYLIPFTAARSEPSRTRVSFILGEVVGPVDISGIALRRREGAPKSVALPPDATVTVTARDFN